ncbi:MAG TPA: DUF1236 domain-containing protein [Aurantimonas sp.]|uniref:DUF1236 domain-containing protein n=1 Tax=Aurantimonas marianensis TaxID=2920428 RepID=A0A9X2HGK9_9HYPH|nr:DUF1236 domain-containing protein [Aurantimonas marianensis]MCP3056639.1 DUF1236 domain-containing protein [Aurantimonas marianensis]
MKIRHIFATGTTTALVALAMPAFAQTAVKATTDLNVRAGPGPNYEIVGMIANEASATVEGCIEGGSWCKVNVDGKEGWAYSDYLTADMSGEQVVVTTRRQELSVPVATYENDAGAGLAGATTGAVAGAIVGGPIGAAIGGAAGLAAGAVIDPPETAVAYVRSNQVDPVYLEGEAVVGASLPETVELREIPDYQYRYVYVNGQPVLVEADTRKVVYVVR